MAKAGFWLRGAKGKLAGASIGKGSDGSTIMREIVTPRNPKTDKQIYQRAIMSSVMLAYSAGKDIFDHAFQGYAKGAENQRRFISLNARRLRNQAVADFNSADLSNNRSSRLVGPKSVSFVPWDYQISEGNYPQNLFQETLVQMEETGIFNPALVLPAPTAGQTVAQYAAANNLVPGDIYTIVIMANDKGDITYALPEEDAAQYGVEGDFGRTFRAEFAFVRLIVKTNLATVTDELTSFGQLFNIEKTANVPINVTELIPGAVLTIDTFQVVPLRRLDLEAQATGAIGIIRSRFDEDLRSTSFMRIADGAEEGSNYGDYFGLIQAAVIPAWKSGETLGNSNLILEGGDENFTGGAE